MARSTRPPAHQPFDNFKNLFKKMLVFKKNKCIVFDVVRNQTKKGKENVYPDYHTL